VPGALETWLALRGVRTLALRVQQQTATATRLAAWLEPRVPRVWHLSLASHPGHALAARQMRGPGAILAIELASEDAARALPGRLRLFREATSLGGVESLVDRRRRWDPEAPAALLRLSIGLEDPADLEADLGQALG
jgi:cystathionine gamma-synthase